MTPAKHKHVKKVLLTAQLLDMLGDQCNALCEEVGRQEAAMKKPPTNCGRPHPQAYCVCIECEAARRDAGPNYKELNMDTKRKIQIGLVYSAKVGGSWLPVRVDKSLGHGRYEGASLPSGKTVKTCTDAINGDGETVEQWQARRKPKKHDLPAAAAEPKAEKPKPPATAKAKKEHRPSGLDAAVAVLAEAGKPMNTADMVKRMLESGLWKTNGKTPAATIYAAIIREISVKGDASRFRKTDRGHFELTAAGIAARTAAGKEAK
jgi:hypothetical protein